jgi:PAS domain S-box-containing protein
LLILITFGASAASSKRVLILNPFQTEIAPYSAVVSEFRTTLARELGEPVDCYDVPLDLARFAEAEAEAPLVAFLEGRIKNHPVDLVVPIGGPGVQFAARHRERLFQDTPVLVIGPDPRSVPAGFLRPNATLVTQRVNLPAMIEDILQVRPQTTNIVVVFGASALEKFWANECRREFQSFTNRVGFTWLNDLSLEQVLERCAALPPRSFILHALFVVDATGVPCEKSEALRRLHQTANAPIFGYYASQFGLGAIGGRLYQDSEIGVQGARTAIRILRGERPGSIPPKVFEAAAPVFDWRELQRWCISEGRLPAGSVIQFRQPGLWERYRWPLAGGFSFCIFQAALIVALLVNRAKRRQSEAEATLIADISSKFVNLPASEVDREIENALRRVCEALGIDLAVLWQWSDVSPGVLMPTHAYCAQKDMRPSGPMRQDQYPWAAQQVLSGRTFTISSLEEFPVQAAVDRETCRQSGIKAGACIPLSVGGERPIGALGLNALRAERKWPGAIVQRLQLVAQILANALARKRTDGTLRESEERMSMATEAAQVGVWGWHITPNQVWGSERWLRLFGFASGANLSFQMVIQRIHPDDGETVEREVRRAVANRTDYAGEFRVVFPDGTQRWITSRGRVQPRADGTASRMLGAAMDITERKRTEEALRASEARLAAGTELAGLGYYEMDYGARTCFLDDRFQEICGIPAELAQSFQAVEFWSKHLHADDLPVLGQERQKLHGGMVDYISLEYRYQHPARGLRWLHHSARFAGRSAGGDQIRTVGVIRDITEQKRAEAELLRQRMELAHLSRVTMLGELSGSMAHELNQPLTAILSNAQAAQRFLAEDQPDLSEVRDILADIVGQDKRAGEVIRRLRLLLKKGEVQHHPLSVNEVVRDVLRLVRSELVNQNFTAHIELAPDLPHVLGDGVQLQQVLLNLVMNACEAMVGGGRDARQFTIRTDRDGNGSVRISVVDCGPGIAPDKLEQIFESFYTTKGKGLGLGLTVSRSIVMAHHGKLWAANNPDRGATFHLTLPTACPEQAGGQSLAIG